MAHRPKNQNEWKGKRLLCFQASPEQADAAEQMAEQPERVDPKALLTKAKGRVEDLNATLEGRFKGLQQAVEGADLPKEKKDSLKAQLDAKLQEVLEQQIDGASELGKELGSHLQDLETKIGEGRLNADAMEGLKVAVDGLKAEELKSQIKASNVKEGTNRAIAYATAPVDFTLGLAGNAIGLAVGHTVRMIGVAFKAATKK